MDHDHHYNRAFDAHAVVALCRDRRRSVIAEGIPQSKLAAWYVEATGALTSVELAAYDVLSVANWLQEALMRHSCRRKLSRDFGRRVGRESGKRRQILERFRVYAKLVRGRSRPVDPVTEFCFRLDRVGLRDREIAELLDALGIEPFGENPDYELCRQRINERVLRYQDRQQRTASP